MSWTDVRNQMYRDGVLTNYCHKCAQRNVSIPDGSICDPCWNHECRGGQLRKAWRALAAVMTVVAEAARLLDLHHRAHDQP